MILGFCLVIQSIQSEVYSTEVSRIIFIIWFICACMHKCDKLGYIKGKLLKLNDIDLQILSPLFKFKGLLYHNDSVSPSQPSIWQGRLMQDFINIKTVVHFVKNHWESITIVLWPCQSNKDLHFLLKQTQDMFDVGFSVASLTSSIMFYMQIGIRCSDGINKQHTYGFLWSVTAIAPELILFLYTSWSFMVIDWQGIRNSNFGILSV